MTKMKKILLVIACVVIVAGIVVTAVFGLNKGIEYSNSKQVKIYLAADVNLEKIKGITNEVFGNQAVLLQKVELFNDEVSITAKDINEDQLAKLVEYTNQEFNLKNSVSDMEIISVPGIDVMDTVVPYIIPVVIVLAIILLYMGIRFKSEGIVKSVVLPLGWVVLVEAVYYSLIAIARIPVSRYTMPIALAVLLATLTTLIYKKEK